MQYTGKWILRTCVQNENIMTFSAKVYISETKRGVETRLKEHKDACIKDFTDKSAIAEHALTEDHPIREGSNLHMNGTRELALQLRRWLPYKKIRGGVRYLIQGRRSRSVRSGLFGRHYANVAADGLTRNSQLQLSQRTANSQAFDSFSVCIIVFGQVWDNFCTGGRISQSCMHPLDAKHVHLCSHQEWAWPPKICFLQPCDCINFSYLHPNSISRLSMNLRFDIAVTWLHLQITMKTVVLLLASIVLTAAQQGQKGQKGEPGQVGYEFEREESVSLVTCQGQWKKIN